MFHNMVIVILWVVGLLTCLQKVLPKYDILDSSTWILYTILGRNIRR